MSVSGPHYVSGFEYMGLFYLSVVGQRHLSQRGQPRGLVHSDSAVVLKSSIFKPIFSGFQTILLAADLVNRSSRRI